MTTPEIHITAIEQDQFITLTGTCDSCKWTGKASIRTGDPHADDMLNSARQDLEQMHREESAECTRPITVAY